MSTYFPSGKGLAENRKWLVVDARGKTVGRLATEVARILSGKNNPAWTPFMDMGDHCVVINARHAKFTGAKDEQKIYLTDGQVYALEKVKDYYTGLYIDHTTEKSFPPPLPHMATSSLTVASQRR